MIDIYKLKENTFEAEKLECDVTLKHKTDANKDFYLQAGNYLIRTPDGRIYPANKELFEYLFEKVEENNEVQQ